jgi:hypothetical protein
LNNKNKTVGLLKNVSYLLLLNVLNISISHYSFEKGVAKLKSPDELAEDIVERTWKTH